MHILIVDGDRIQRLILRNQLVRLGYEVSEAIDGASAWTQLQHETAPIVITDWMMPQLDGPGRIARIRAGDFPGYTYVILLTAKDERTDMIAGLDSGADDYLIKPCASNELRARGDWSADRGSGAQDAYGARYRWADRPAQSRGDHNSGRGRARTDTAPGCATQPRAPRCRLLQTGQRRLWSPGG